MFEIIIVACLPLLTLTLFAVVGALNSIASQLASISDRLEEIRDRMS